MTDLEKQIEKMYQDYKAGNFTEYDQEIADLEKGMKNSGFSKMSAKEQERYLRALQDQIGSNF